MFHPRRKICQSLLKRKYFLCLYLFILSIILFYLIFNREYFLILKSKQISVKINITNDFQKENNTLQISPSIFQSIIPSYYPRLPIHMFNQNLTSLKNQTKLILLGNGFFGDEKWGLDAIGKSSTEIMTQLSCPFLSNYCDITIDKKRFSQADAVVYHIRDDIDRYRAKKFRRPNQRFVFTLWESPLYTPDLKSYNEFFNWTMTYRFQSHIITSYYFINSYIHKSNNYYHFMLKEIQEKKLYLQFKKVDYKLSDEILEKKRLGTVAALISNCGGESRRSRFIRFLKKFIHVQVYGKCGQPCPKNIDCREFIAENFYFFLSFENSLCSDYTTEKFFATLHHPIVPVVYGRTNYSYFIPSSGFIDTNDFVNITSLAKYLNQTRLNKEKYLSYFLWKKDYIWGMTHLLTPFCDLCVRLHLDSTPNIIKDIDTWWHSDTCSKAPRFI